MPPHCETMDGPVVESAEMALEMENINYILPYIAMEDEKELKEAFERTLKVRELSADAAELADLWFFETAVRLHRKGENKPYNGLKPAGTDWGPMIRQAERAIDTENLDELLEFVLEFIQEDIKIRFEEVISKKGFELNQVEEARDYVNSALEFILYTHHLYQFVENG